MFRNGLQFWHIVVLLLVVLILFGANKLPDVARSVGRSMKILKEEVKDLRDEPGATTQAAAAPPAPAPPVTPPRTTADGSTAPTAAPDDRVGGAGPADR
jgi:sec-independent protein translocase protein TatA